MTLSFMNLPAREAETFVRGCAVNRSDANDFHVVVVDNGPIIADVSTHRTVTVKRLETGLSREYPAGPRFNWVLMFIADLCAGYYHVSPRGTPGKGNDEACEGSGSAGTSALPRDDRRLP